MHRQKVVRKVRVLAPAVTAAAPRMDEAFVRVALRFLKHAATFGYELEQLTVTVFDDVFSPPDFDGALTGFVDVLVDEIGLRKRLGKALVDVMMPAVVAGYNIDQLIDELEKYVKAPVYPRSISGVNSRRVLVVLEPQTH